MKEVIKRNQTLGKRIRTLMDEKGITQKEMCDRLGIVRSTLNRYLHGDHSINPVLLKGIADALDMTVEELIGGNADE